MVTAGSRYIHTPLYIDRNNLGCLAIRNRYTFDLTNATFYTFVRGDTIDGIAYKQYGNALLGWAILDVNTQYMTEMDINVGDVLIIPPFEEVVKVSE